MKTEVDPDEIDILNKLSTEYFKPPRRQRFKKEQKDLKRITKTGVRGRPLLYNLLFGFTLARANARMLINAEAKRRSAGNSARASRPQCTSAVAVHG